MESKTLKYYLLGLIFFFSFQSCISTKTQIVLEKEIIILNSYYQKLIPGESSQKTKYIFYLELKDSLDIIDSIAFKGEVKHFIKRKNFYESDLGRDVDRKVEGIIIFYHNGKKRYRNSIQNVLIKEPLYLP
jgi:hypothetical protein